MQKKFLSSLAFFLFVNLLVKPVYVFGIDRVVQNRVGVEDYGNYFSLFNFILILQIILDLGLENFNRKEIAQNPAKINNLFALTFPIKIVLGFAYLIVCSLIAFARGFNHEEWSIFLILIGNQFIASFILYLRAQMGGLQLFKLEGIVSVLDRSIMILLCGIILYAPFYKGDMEIKWFVLSQTIAYAVTFLIAFTLVLRKAGKLNFHFEIKKYIPILRSLMPFAILVLLQSFYFRIDSILLEELLPNGEQQAGIYAHAFRIIELLTSYALLFPMLLLPMFSAAIKENKSPVKLLKLGILILIVPSTIGMIGLFFYRYDIFNLLYHSHIKESANTFAFLSISFIGMCFSYTFGALLTANKNLKQLNYMSLSAVVISAVLNLILIPKFHVLGAGMANAGVQVFSIIIHLILVNRFFTINIRFKKLATVLLLLGVTILSGFYVSQHITNYIAGIFVICCIGFGLAFALRIIKISDFLAILKESKTSI